MRFYSAVSKINRTPPEYEEAMTLFGQALAFSDKFREPYHYVAYAYALSLSGDHKTSKEVLAKPIFLFAIIAASVLLLSSCSKGKLVGTLLVHFNEPVKEEVTVYIYIRM